VAGAASIVDHEVPGNGEKLTRELLSHDSAWQLPLVSPRPQQRLLHDISAKV
jgi:hypothetical protein